MNIECNLSAVTATEFGVGRETDGGTGFGVVPVDAGVQSALLSMAQATIDKMGLTAGGPGVYDPAEKHGSTEYLVVPSDGTLDAAIRELHDAESLAFDDARLSDPETIFCYFARFTDHEHRRLTAIRRAAQFKGVLKRKLLRFDDDTLKIVDDNVFKLDSDFDMLVDSACTHIWRPSAFEFLGRLKQVILDAVPDNISAIASDLPFIELSGVEEYAQSHPRAARYLASIRSQALEGMDRGALIELCDSTGVDIQEANGKIEVTAGGEMGFLEVLDRRRYRVELVPDQPEQFRAPSRVRIDGVRARTLASRRK